MASQSHFRLPPSRLWVSSLILLWSSLLPAPASALDLNGLAKDVVIVIGVISGIVGLILAIAFGNTKPNLPCVRISFCLFGVADLAIGGFVFGFWIIVADVPYTHPLALGVIFQLVSGVWRVIVACVDWEPIWYLWLLPFLPSLMSPVAYAAGFPSLALVALMTYNNRAARRGSEAGSENQVLFFSGSASDFEPEPEPGSSLAVTDPVDPTTGSGKHT